MKKSLLALLLAPTILLALVSVSYSQYTTIQITDNSYADSFPQINDNREVVWQEYDGSDDEVFHGNGFARKQP